MYEKCQPSAMSSSRRNKSRLYVCLYSRNGTAKMPGLEDAYHWGVMIGPKIALGFRGPTIPGPQGEDRTDYEEGNLFDVKQELKPLYISRTPAEEQTEGSATRGTELAAAVPSDLAWRWTISEQHVMPFVTGENQPQLLARFVIGKIVSKVIMRLTILNTPVEGEENPEFNDVIWVREVIANVACTPQAMGTGIRLWETIRDKCMRYMEAKKKQHRWDGQGRFDQTQIPTWDLMTDEELIK